MSASPAPTATAPSQKRPLEEPSSDAGVTDQPEAKRPALDNLVKDDATDGDRPLPESIANGTNTTEPNDEDNEAENNGPDDDAVDSTEVSLAANEVPTGDSIVATGPSASEVLETQPIQSTAVTNGTSGGQSPLPNQHVDESGWLHIRAIISSAEAATVIGKGGENVTLIRRMSGAKCTVSDYSRGAVERILTVSGLVDAVAKAFGLIIRTLNQEPLEAPSSAQSKTYPLRLLIPHILIGSIIGQKGVRIREIQEASGARLNVSDACLPLSTERSLVVLGVADAVHIATYYVGSTLVEQLTERFGGPAASAYATRSGGPAGAVPGGMQVVPYTPQPAGGQWGHPDNYRRHPTQQSQRQPANAYGVPYGSTQMPQQHQQQMGMQYSAGSPRHGYSAGPHGAQGYGQPQHSTPQQGMPSTPQQNVAGGGGMVPGGHMTQQIYIPNDMVGAIIGKGGAKINEIRQLSNSVIKINEPQDNSNERLVTITGTQECNQMALFMLYSRLESEKHRI